VIVGDRQAEPSATGRRAEFPPVNAFRDRVEAGRLLGRALVDEKLAAPREADLLILAIPRGGVVIGAEVARILEAPLEVWLSHKLGAPGNPEFAIGSVSSHGETWLDQATLAALGVSDAYLQEVIRRERAELERRLRLFRGNAEPVAVEGRHVILVDDGAATGSTALAALAALERGKAAKRTLALPVAPRDLLPVFKTAADAVLVLNADAAFMAVGQFYDNFEPVEDAEVVRILAERH
jgi:putative phosphoribosyl transferase